MQSVAPRCDLDHCLESQGIVRSRERIGITEIDLILSRAHFMMRAFRTDPHLFQHQTDLTADILALILRRYVHIARFIIRETGRAAVIIQLEEIKFHLCAEDERRVQILCVADSAFQQSARIALKGSLIRISDVAEHPHHSSMLRPPRQDQQRVRIGMQQEIRMGFITKTVNGRRIESNAAGKCSGELSGHDGNVFLPAITVAEGQTDEFHIFFTHVQHDFFWSIFHRSTRFLCKFVVISLFCPRAL